MTMLLVAKRKSFAVIAADLLARSESPDLPDQQVQKVVCHASLPIACGYSGVGILPVDDKLRRSTFGQQHATGTHAWVSVIILDEILKLTKVIHLDTKRISDRITQRLRPLLLAEAGDRAVQIAVWRYPFGGDTCRARSILGSDYLLRRPAEGSSCGGRRSERLRGSAGDERPALTNRRPAPAVNASGRAATRAASRATAADRGPGAATDPAGRRRRPPYGGHNSMSR